MLMLLYLYEHFSRLELAIATQNLDAKQAELTMVADDVFNKTLNDDTDNRHSMLGAKDEIRNVCFPFGFCTARII